MPIDCEVYRCARQPDLYLYLRPGLDPAQLPAALLQRTGRLTRVMSLDLAARGQLARVDASAVLRQLQEPGFFLQLPPAGAVAGHLDDGD